MLFVSFVQYVKDLWRLPWGSRLVEFGGLILGVGLVTVIPVIYCILHREEKCSARSFVLPCVPCLCCQCCLFFERCSFWLVLTFACASVELRMERAFLQKGGVPAAPSGTATLLRLSPNYQFCLRSLLAVTNFRHPRLSWLDGRCVQGPGTYSPRHG